MVRKWVYVIGSIMCVVKEDKICGVYVCVWVCLCHSVFMLVYCWCGHCVSSLLYNDCVRIKYGFKLCSLCLSLWDNDMQFVD